MEPDIDDLPPPSEEEIRWIERMAEGEDLFPGEGGIVAIRMRIRAEAAARRQRFLDARQKPHKKRRPRVLAEAA
jgi:hypothetical protein